MKQNIPDQNAINLSNTVLYEDQKSLLVKDPSFAPTPSDIKWYEARKDFSKFINKNRQHAETRQHNKSYKLTKLTVKPDN